MVEIYKPKEYATFRRMDGNVIPGLNLKAILCALLALGVGLLIFVVLGQITYTTQAELEYSDKADNQEHYSLLWSCLSYETQKANLPESEWETSLGSLRKITLSEYTESEVEAFAAKAKSVGIKDTMTQAQAESLAPTTHEIDQPYLNKIERLAIALVPVILVIALKFENKGICLEREIKQALIWRKNKKTYFHQGA